MQAVVLTEFGEPEVLRVVERPTPRPGSGEVLLKISACGVCGHDVLQRRGLVEPEASRGVIPGHEIAGVVVEVGEDVPALEPGDRVAATMGARVCGICHHCRVREDTLCRQRILYGEALPGGYAEFVVIEASGVANIPANVDDFSAAIAGCGIATSVHAFKLAGVNPGAQVAVTGAGGGVGVHALQVAHTAGAEVIAITSSEHKLKTLAPLADAVILAEKGRFAAQFRARGLEPDVVLELTASYTLEESMRAVRRGGQVMIAGNLDDRRVPLLPGAIIYRGIRIAGSKGANTEDLSESLELLASGAVKAKLAHRFPLSRAADAHALAESNAETGRIMLVPDRQFSAG